MKTAQTVFKPKFKGYMKVPLGNADSLEAAFERVVFTGQWATHKHRILRKDRRFKATAHVFMYDGSKAVVTVDHTSKSDKDTVVDLTDMAYQATIEGLGPDDRKKINMWESYTVIRA